MVRYRIRHRSRYQYGRPVELSHHIAHLLPRDTARQTVLDVVLAADPLPPVIHRQTDYFGNGVAYLSLLEPHRQLTVDMQALVRVEAHKTAPLASSMPWEAVREALANPGDPALIEAAEFRFPSSLAPLNALTAAYARESFTPGRPILEAARELTSRIKADFTYDAKATDIGTTLDEVMRARRGVCQDFAQLQISALRGLHLAARYVSGYLRNDGGRAPEAGLELASRAASSRPVSGGTMARERVTKDDKSVAVTGGANANGAGGLTAMPAGFVGADASHAWVAVFCPEQGWVEFDPTNDLLVQEDHIVLGWGRDYRDVSPIGGVILGGGRHSLGVEVEVKAMA